VPPPNVFHRNHHIHLNLKTCYSEEKQALIWFKNTNMALTSYFLERRPHHGSHIVFVFWIMFLKSGVKK